MSTAVAEFEAQPALQPGAAGWWRVWGAKPHHVRAGDIVITRGERPVFVTDTFTAKAAPMRQGLVDQDGERFTLGALCPIVLVRPGTHNTLA